jgi:multidrug efflux pump subunit AcrB
MGSLLVLSSYGGTLQRVSLASFVLAMGMLVDNAIVILDGIQVDLKRGIPRREAMTGIGKKTAMPLLGATLIAILAFLPIFMSPDNTGVYVKDLFIVLAVSLLLSWIMALTVVPLHADRLMKVKDRKKESLDEQFNSKYYKWLRTALSWILNHRLTSVVVCVAMVLASLLCFRYVKQGFFPDMDYDQLYIEYKLPEGYNSTREKADLGEIEDYLLSRKDVTHVSTSIGATPFRYCLVRGMGNSSLSYGELIVDYTSPKALVTSMEEIQNYLTANFPDASVRLRRYNLMDADYPIEVEFSGPDPAILRKLTKQAENIMSASPDLYLITNDWRPKVPVLKVKYNQPIARNLGLSRQDVGLSLLAADDGFQVGTFYDGIRNEAINIKCVDMNGKPLKSLNNTPVFTMLPSLRDIDKNTINELITGTTSTEDVLASSLQTIPLSQATDGIDVKWENPWVLRRNGERAMKAQCSVRSGTGVENAREAIADKIENIKLPEGYSMRWAGERSLSVDSTYYLFIYYPLSVVIMIAILIMLFKDYKKPLILLLCLPLLSIGLVFGILISGKTFGFVAVVGTLGLVGMLIKSGIVLMDEISFQILSGVEPYQALLNSASVRFRPVMLASLTTVLGMVPLLDDSLFGPAAVVIIGGLLVSTLIILLLIPLLYSVFFGIKTKTNKLNERND